MKPLARSRRSAWLGFAISLLACDPLHTDVAHEKPEYRRARAHAIDSPPVPAVVRVMNWNIKFGGGRIDFFFDCFGAF